MRVFISSFAIFIIASLFILITEVGCTQKDKTAAGPDTLNYSTSPVLSARDAISKMHIEDGFEVKLVASEPLIAAPVAMSFDKDGRIWVVQMNDYMSDTLGTGEDKPTGKVVILTDKNNDGVMDDRKVFLDSLILPRAICLIEDGILVAEPPSLWYYTIKDDKAVGKTLVDAEYAEGGNVEHQPNGLLRAMDNWIYSAKSAKRYRKKGDKWLIEKTHFRGQWGISQDEWGRLFYNNNSENLLGDEFSPGLGATNENQKRVTGFDKKIVTDNKVYAVRPTPGVNRGYMKGVLNEEQKLVNFTAACGPVIYTGNVFPKNYYGNAFVAEPSANLVKRNLLITNGYRVDGKQAYEDKEFLASEDERFRPVNLYNAPDGALYVVDMYRGIIQHKTYLTPYLKNEIKKRGLTNPLSCGRIYKIVPKETEEPPIRITTDSTVLLHLLYHPNAWMRYEAQQLLIDGRNQQSALLLRRIVQQRNNLLAATHALWTLEGLEALTWSDVQPLLNDTAWSLRSQALSVLPSVINKTNYRQILPVLQSMVEEDDTLAAPYIGFLAHSIQPIDKKAAHDLLINLSKKYGANLYVADAIISNLQNQEGAFYKEIIKLVPDTAFTLNKRLKKILDDIAASKNVSDADKVRKQFPRGARIFQTVCQTCHGKDGNGVAGLAPPLNKAQWVMDKNKLIPIVLYGLSGPIEVNGKMYKAPEINGDMPGIGQSPEYGNEDISDVLNFVRNSWNNKGEKITPEEVNQVKIKYKGRVNTFTGVELQQQK